MAKRSGGVAFVSGFFDGRAVSYLLTDVSLRKDAQGLSKFYGSSVHFAPKLDRIGARGLAKLYLFMNGVKGANPFGFQANVLDSVPGMAKYSPLWRVYAVKWKAGIRPGLLKSEAAVLNARTAGKLTITNARLIKDSPVVPRRPPLVGGFYNGSAVNYFLTDVSTRKDASALSKATKFPVNYVAKLNRVPERALARLYLFTNGVKGPNPFGFQANVLDSVPGMAKYSPLWRVYAVTWRAGVRARLLKSEAAVLSARTAGKLTITRTALIKNSPVVS